MICLDTEFAGDPRGRHMTDNFDWVENWADIEWIIRNSLKESLISGVGNEETEDEDQIDT